MNGGFGHFTRFSIYFELLLRTLCDFFFSKSCLSETCKVIRSNSQISWPTFRASKRWSGTVGQFMSQSSEISPAGISEICNQQACELWEIKSFTENTKNLLGPRIMGSGVPTAPRQVTRLECAQGIILGNRTGIFTWRDSPRFKLGLVSNTK